MKPLLPLAVFVLSILSVPAAEQTGTNEITQLETAWNSAHLRSDADTVDKLCTEDFVVTLPGMGTRAKKEAIGALRSGRIKFSRYETTDTRIQLYNGDTAIVTGGLQRTRSINDRSMDDDWRFTKVWVRLAGKWQVASFHATPNGQ